MKKKISLSTPSTNISSYDADISDMSDDTTDSPNSKKTDETPFFPKIIPPKKSNSSPITDTSNTYLPEIISKQEISLTNKEIVEYITQSIYKPFKIIFQNIDEDADLLNPKTYPICPKKINPILNKLNVIDSIIKNKTTLHSGFIKSELINKTFKKKYLCFLTFLDAINYNGELKTILALSKTKSISIKKETDYIKYNWESELNELHNLIFSGSTTFEPLKFNSTKFENHFLTLCGVCARIVTKESYNQLNSIKLATSKKELINSLYSLLTFILELKNLIQLRILDDKKYEADDVLTDRQDFLRTLTTLFNNITTSEDDSKNIFKIITQTPFLKDSEQDPITTYFQTQITKLITFLNGHLNPYIDSKYYPYEGQDFNGPF